MVSTIDEEIFVLCFRFCVKSILSLDSSAVWCVYIFACLIWLFGIPMKMLTSKNATVDTIVPPPPYNVSLPHLLCSTTAGRVVKFAKLPIN